MITCMFNVTINNVKIVTGFVSLLKRLTYIPGKTLKSQNPSLLLVPHRFFTHFYVTGFLFNSLCMMDLFFHFNIISSAITYVEIILETVLNSVGIKTEETYHFLSSQSWLPSILLQLQLTRRLLESLLIVRHDKSKMHISHLMFALCYYPVVSLSINISTVQVSTPVSILSVLLFVWASLHQYRCHVILAELRAEDPNVYGIPYGDWFEFVSSPHYLAEILIYISIFISSGGGYLLGANCVYQIVNFSLICTPPTHYWYLKKFDNYPSHRKILIPFIY